MALQTCVKLQNVHFRFRQSCKNAAETYLSAGVIFVFSRFTFYHNFAKDVSPTIFRLIGDFDPFSDLFDHRSLFRPFSDLSDLPGHPVTYYTHDQERFFGVFLPLSRLRRSVEFARLGRIKSMPRGHFFPAFDISGSSPGRSWPEFRKMTKKAGFPVLAGQLESLLIHYAAGHTLYKVTSGTALTIRHLVNRCPVLA